MKEFQPENTTVIICCAGMGTRLGIGTTKALVDIDGIPLIVRQLELLKEYSDIRIVAGFQAERLIEVVKNYRRDIMIAFNYMYETTGVADSLRKGLVAAKDYVVSIDGDILVNPDDFHAFLSTKEEMLAVTKALSTEPILATVKSGQVQMLSKTHGNMQWPGIVKLRRDKISNTSAHVYDVLNGILPMRAFELRAKEIDTQEDYENALEWFINGQGDLT